jgi:hypothetical protein
MAIHK